MFLEVKKMKRFLWLQLMLVVLCLFLVACGEKTSPSINDSAKNTSDESKQSMEEATCLHVFGEWQTTKEATCKDLGKTKRVCTKCSAEEKETIPKTTNHKVIVDPMVESTCVKKGKTEGKHCSVCNYVIVKQIDLPIAAHTYDNDKDEKCNVCKHIRDLSCKHTNIIIVNSIVPTCKSAGLTEGKKCSICNEILVPQKTVSALGHTGGEWITDKEATCTANGSKYQRCSVCSEKIKTETIAAKGHVAGEWITDKEATCTANGSKHQVCSVCDDTVKTEVLNQFGHSMGPWTMDKAATCTTNGHRFRICSICGHFESSTIEKLGHNKTVPISANKRGQAFYGTWSCDRCNNKFTEEFDPITSTFDKGLSYGNYPTYILRLHPNGGTGNYKYFCRVYDTKTFNVIGTTTEDSDGRITYVDYAENALYANNLLLRIYISDDFGTVVYDLPLNNGTFANNYSGSIYESYKLDN